MLLENGTYRAVTRDISVYLRGENERLTAALRLECEGKDLVHREWLELNDGTISDKTIRRMRACFPKWDGSIETLEQGFCVKDEEVDITIENEQDREDPEKWWTRVRYMDPPGGASGAAAMPAAEDRASLVSKYGSRFRALAGGSQVAVNSDQSTVPRAGGQGGKAVQKETEGMKVGAPVAATPLAPPPVVEASSLEACWEALCKKHPDELREQVSQRWFEMLAQVVPGRDQADFEPEDWGQVLAEIGLPF